MRPVGIDHVHVLIALAGRRCARDWARHGVGAEIGLVLNRAALRADQVMRTERGFAVRIIVFSTKTAMATCLSGQAGSGGADWARSDVYA